MMECMVVPTPHPSICTVRTLSTAHCTTTLIWHTVQGTLCALRLHPPTPHRFLNLFFESNPVF